VESSAQRSELTQSGSWEGLLQGSLTSGLATDGGRLLPVRFRQLSASMRVRRFRYDVVRCKCRIFGERLAGDVLSAFVRRTGRLERIVHHLALALGDRPGESLMLPMSRDTLAGGPASPPEPLRSVERHRH
jgi:hypothetical protein